MAKEKNGSRISVGAGETFFHSNESLDRIFLIVKGQARAESPFLDVSLEPGAIAGIMDICSGHYQFDYTAESDMIVISFPVKHHESIYSVFDLGKNYQELAITSMLYQLDQLMQVYLDRFSGLVTECVESSQNESQNIPELDLSVWEYLSAIGSLGKNMYHEFFTSVDVITYQHILMGAGLASQVFAVMDKMVNIYGIDTFIQEQQGAEQNEIPEMIDLSKIDLGIDQTVGNVADAVELAKNMKPAGETDQVEAAADIQAREAALKWAEQVKQEEERKRLEFIQQAMQQNDQTEQQGQATTPAQAAASVQATTPAQAATPVQTATPAKTTQPEQTTNTAKQEEPVSLDQVKEELGHALQKILSYSGMDLMESKKYEVKVQAYRELPDRFSSDNEVRQLRKEIAEGFYHIYEMVFFKAIKEAKLSRLIELFLKFGFMDERGFSDAQLLELYQLKTDYDGSKYQIYTVYDWLCAIYRGDREPSKNEMDVDYRENLRELKRTRQFTQQEENSYLTDQDNKVRFEIHNLMRTTSKITSGAITIFCPILDPGQLGSNMAQMLMTAQRLEKSMDQLLDVDYSVFYREQMYYDAQNKIDNILIMKQVLPDFILMPTVGSRGIMWQEISEKKRDTPARMVLSQFVSVNLDDLIINMAAAFRWEMCRTVQGNYWNDIRDHSLTSEYCDYVQFYRKNKDLSDDMKEKVHAQFKSCRNSYKEMFIKDYAIWVRYESKGSLRLNKAVRKILYLYCPFAMKYRDNVSKQPVYEDACARFNRQRQAKIRELKSFHSNVLKRNGKITEALEENLAYYEKM